MALVVKDRVKEQTTTTGTGSVTLGGAVSGFQTFGAAVGNANTTYYAIVHQTADEWEVGLGTYTAAGTLLSRDTILESTNSDAAVNFSAGTKDVFVTYPSDKAIYADGSGNVGIGTSSPASRLTVSDGSSGLTPFSGTDVFMDSSGDNYLQFGSGSSSSSAIYFGDSADGDAGGIIYSHATDAMSFRANAAERMRIDSSGNVGIGTASPSQKLTIQGTDARIYLTGANTDIDMTGTADGQLSLDGNGFGFGIALNSSGANLYTNSASRALILGTDETERMRITGTGNVGIGTNSPAVKLDVAGSIRNTPDNSSYMYVGRYSAGYGGSVLNTSGGSTFLSLQIEGSEKMRIDSSGNVGIGTSSPDGKLDIATGGTTDVVAALGGTFPAFTYRNGTGSWFHAGKHPSSDYFYIGRGATPTTNVDLVVTSSGTVGIGTSSPYGTLTVNSSGTGSIYIADGSSSSTSNRYISFYHDDGLLIQTRTDANGWVSDDYVINNNASGATAHRWNIANSEKMRINSSGNVGIGNTAPAGPLEVLNVNASGSSGENGFLFGSTGQIAHSTDNTLAIIMTDSSSAAGTHNYIVFRYQASSIGDIDTVDNSTIRYNTFTGAHWSQFTDHSQPEIPLGTVMSTINEMCNYTQFEYVDGDGQTQKTDIAGSFEIGSTHTIYIDEDGAQAEGTAIAQSTHKRLAKVKVSDTAGDKSVYGVFAGHYKDGDSSIESLGLGAIRVGSGVTVANGDLLESAGDGTARPQTGDSADLFKASTIAKVTSTTAIETYDDGSYTVPCTLHCG